MTCYILNEPDMTYTDRCISLDLLPLSYRREIADLCLLLKYFCGAVDVDFSQEVCFIENVSDMTLHSRDPLQLQAANVRTETFKSNSYFNRIVNLWNSLPYDTRASASINVFKSNVTSLYHTILDWYDVSSHSTWVTCCPNGT